MNEIPTRMWIHTDFSPLGMTKGADAYGSDSRERWVDLRTTDWLGRLGTFRHISARFIRPVVTPMEI